MWDELGLSARMARPDDVDLVVELIHAAEEVDLGEAFTSASDVEADWADPRIDLDHDVLLVFDGSTLVGLSQVSEGRADADVHPSARGRGIGLALVEWSEQRALERAEPAAEVRIGQTVPEDLVGINGLFAERGYERLWDSWVLRMPVGADLTPPPVPAGMAVRPYEPSEEREVYEVIEAAFGEWEQRDPQAFEDWQTLVTRRPDFDPSLLFVATDGHAILGAAHAIDYGFEGWLNQVAVRPDHRGQGIAKALLMTAFGELRGRGRETLGLNTDSRTGALGLYTGIGMTLDQTFVRWSRLLRPAA